MDRFAAALARVRPQLPVRPVGENIFQRDAVIAAAQADILFSCVDSSEGRQIAGLIAQAFMIALIDMGVTIPTRRLVDGSPAIVEVMGRIDYVQPGGATLGDLAVYTPMSLRAKYLARTDPERFAAVQREGYVKAEPVEAPSVIALNMRAAGAALRECVARLLPFRHDGNARYARTLFALASVAGVHRFFVRRGMTRKKDLPCNRARPPRYTDTAQRTVLKPDRPRARAAHVHR